MREEEPAAIYKDSRCAFSHLSNYSTLNFAHKMRSKNTESMSETVYNLRVSEFHFVNRSGVC